MKNLSIDDLMSEIWAAGRNCDREKYDDATEEINRRFAEFKEELDDADNLRMQLRQETARLNHADEEIERLNKLNEKLRDIAKSFKEQTRKALAEQYKLSVRITELQKELLEMW